MLAVIYLAAILVTSILYPQEALPFMLAATGQTIVAVVVGIALAALLTQVILRRIRIGDELRAKFGESNLEDAFVKAIGSEEGLHA